jgi:hypothetical protein
VGRTKGATNFEPTKAQRDFVETAAACGLVHDQIVLVLPMEDGRAPLSTDALVKHFKDELAKGKARVIMKLGGECFRMAAGLDEKVQGKDRAPFMFFFLKTQGGWKETSVVEHELPAGDEASEDAALARIAGLLEKGRRRAAAPGQLLERRRRHGGKAKPTIN